MARVELLGTLEMGADGIVHVRRPDIPPLPPRPEQPIKVPTSVARAIRANRARVFAIVGDSMQPGILHGDSSVVSMTRSPRNADVVVVRSTSPHRIFGAVSGYVWRYHHDHGHRYLTKDNPRYSERRSVSPQDILGVVTRVLPSQFRDEFENYETVQCERELYRAMKWGQPPADFGFYRAARVAELNSVIDIPREEMLDDRLPWGMFRGIAKADHPHLEIVAGDILTIEANSESHVGVTVIERHDSGETIVGVLQREGLGTSAPGEFYVDRLDRRVLRTRRCGDVPLWSTIGLVRQVAHRKRSAIARAAAERQAERMAAGAGDQRAANASRSTRSRGGKR